MKLYKYYKEQHKDEIVSNKKEYKEDITLSETSNKETEDRRELGVSDETVIVYETPKIESAARTILSVLIIVFLLGMIAAAVIGLAIFIR